MDINSLIANVNKLGGSELLLKIGAKPIMRSGKTVKHMAYPALTPEDMKHLFAELLTPANAKIFTANGTYEANYFRAEPCNFRLHLFYSQQQPVALIKLLNKTIPTLEGIGLGSLKPMLEAKKGLFIVSGPVRSGISTTLAAIVEEINLDLSRHVLLIEDTIEFEFVSKRSIISQRQFRKDFASIPSAINFARRMDVDVLVIGDLKHDIPFNTILNHVSGGHFVIMSMQTLGIEDTIDQFIYAFHESDRDYVCKSLAQNLLGICSQSLLIGDMNKIVPVRETLIVNSMVARIIGANRLSQLMPTIHSAGPGSTSFADSVRSLIASGDIGRKTGDDFLEYIKNIKA